MITNNSNIDIHEMRQRFGSRLQLGVPLARYTSARVGGPAEALVETSSRVELAEAAQWLWEMGMPFLVLGGGSNVLVSDAGVHGMVILNHARHLLFEDQDPSPTLWAESGANFGMLARLAANRGFAGLEWAAGIPGTLGGAVVGNAGAHGGDMSGSLVMAEILHQDGEIELWPVEKMGYTYRSSVFKRKGLGMLSNPVAVILSAVLRLEASTVEAVQARIDELVTIRRRTQPPGASMGSMFKNPTGDYAGRLIEASGLKGTRMGDAQISPLHANFFMNLGEAKAQDIKALMDLAGKTVKEKFGVVLELEIELVGEW
jgi:UDP-N-acetylmuramate dehydrogenase